MTEEICKNIYRIGVPLPGNPLKELNSYFIRGTASDLLIDTGFRRDACREALAAALDSLGSDPSRRDILLTHLHSDHSGMADLFVGESRTVYIYGTDLDYLRAFAESPDPEFHHQRYIREGFGRDRMNEIYRTNPAMTERMHMDNVSFRKLQDGDAVAAGDYKLETLHVPGHTPGSCMFYLREKKILFTGDHVLFDITPNICCWPLMADALGDYLESLRRVRDIPVDLALPGHRKPGDYRERIDTLLAHHERRLAEALSVVRETPGLNATEIAGLMRWKIRAASWDTFPLIQKWFAVGECLSHLDHHMQRGHIRFEEKDGIRYYYAV